MQIHDPRTLKTITLPELPVDGYLELEVAGLVQTVVACAEGFGPKTRLNLILGGILVVIALIVAGPSLILFVVGTLPLPALLFAAGLSVLLTTYGYLLARPSLQASYSHIEFNISNGFLRVEHHGRFSDKSSIISLAHVNHTAMDPTFPSPSSASLCMWLPTFNEHPSLGEYKCFVVNSRRTEDVKWLKRWIDRNIDIAKEAAS